MDYEQRENLYGIVNIDQKETVTLALKTYNDMKHIVDGLKDVDKFCFYTFGAYEFKTKDEALDILGRDIKRLRSEIYELKNPKDKQTSVSDLKDMNLWELLKWKLNGHK